MSETKTVSTAVVASLLIAFASAIREVDYPQEARYQEKLLQSLDRHLAPLLAEDSPLPETDKRNLETLRTAFEKYLDSPLLWSH
ncbi:MAG: hypothetical protein OXI22_17295 [Defluviicoccus sp.]|nr:hypothetical protein [Defluviicoccus sp.]MDE0385642.1 hypothetical protein [Defluviicoccus sp.]